LRDPLARPVEAVLGESYGRLFDIEWELRPFLALDAPIVLARARESLAPPPEIDCTLADGVLRLSGQGSHAWITRARALAGSLPGITSWETAQLVDQDLEALKLRLAQLGAIRIECDPTTGASAGELLALEDGLHALPALTSRAEMPVGVRVHLPLIFPTTQEERLRSLAHEVGRGLVSFAIERALSNDETTLSIEVECIPVSAPDSPRR
jgi:hypothetical protein